MARAKISREDRQFLPHSEDAERAVIGSILVDPDAILKAQEIGLQVPHFYNQHLAWIYESAQLLATKGKPVDLTLLQADLEGRQDGEQGRSRFAAIGGPGAMLKLIDMTVTSMNVGYYAQEVVNLARKRDLLAAAANIAALTQSHEGDIDDLMSQVSQIILPAVSVEGSRSHSYGSGIALTAYIDNQNVRAERMKRDPETLMVTGFQDLDAILGDLVPGYLHVVAAKSSVGKTMYMEHVMETNARRGKRVAFYHLELGHDVMMDRLIARHAKISTRDLRNGYDGIEIDNAIREIGPWFDNIVYVHCPGWSAERVAADIQRLTARGECDLAIVDYLQKLSITTTGRTGFNAAMLLGFQAEALKIAAEICNVPIVLGTQVNRKSMERENDRPSADDIRNSGEVLEKANQVVMLHRPGKRENLGFGETEAMEVWVEKNTGGALGHVELVHIAGRYLLASVRKGA